LIESILHFENEFQGSMMAPTNEGFTVKSHFERKDAVVGQIYDRILKSARKFGGVGEEPKKTSIHLVNRTAFAGVVTRKSAIILTIRSDRKLSSPRIHKSEQTSASRFHHEIKLASPADVDSELVKWLKDAYALSA
jgi:hypothetical protein